MIDGIGRNFNTGDLINRRVKKIHTLLGTSFLTVGDDNVGSYNLASNRQSYHSLIVENNINTIEEGINGDLIPQLLAINGWILDDEDMPVFKAGNISDPDKDDNSKAVQRAGAVGFIPLHPSVVNQTLRDLSYDYQIPQEIVDDIEKWEEYAAKFMPKSTSAAASGMESGMPSGTGDASGGSGDGSISNTEHA